ncbi:MAG: hypothetical protein ACRYE8_03475 [Janthinobacterium lividum]
MLFLLPREDVVAWINFSCVISRLDRRIQLKILKLLVLKIALLDPVVRPRDDTEHICRSTRAKPYAGMTYRVFFD